MKPFGIFKFLLVSGFIYTGCRSESPVKFNPAGAVSNLSAAQTQSAAAILQDYYGLKDALVATDEKKADQAGRQMHSSLIRFREGMERNIADSTVYPGGFTALDTQILKMTDQLDHILSVQGDGCERKRIYFKPLSDLVYTFLKTTGIRHIQAYHHYCPMALNEQGAYWLSVSPEIENPYFGQKMLTCGELVDTLK